MAVVTYALSSRANVKRYLQIADAVTSYDVLLDDLINAATDFVEKYCGRRFLSSTYTNEVYNGEGTKELILKNWPVSTFTQLDERDNTENSDSWDTKDTGDYYVDLDNGIVIATKFNFRNFPRHYRVTYTAGYNLTEGSANNLPWDLELACKKMVSIEFNKRRAQGIKSETLGEYSVTWADEELKQAGIYDILDKYARRNV